MSACSALGPELQRIVSAAWPKMATAMRELLHLPGEAAPWDAALARVGAEGIVGLARLVVAGCLAA